MLKCDNCELIERIIDKGITSVTHKCSVLGEFVSKNDECKVPVHKVLTIIEQMLSVVRSKIQ